MRYLIILIILLLAYPLLSNIGFYESVERKRMVDVPRTITREVTIQEPQEREVCDEREFAYTTYGGNVEELGQYAVPDLTITNQEEQWGLFKANFSFIDEERFPYASYGGTNLSTSLENGLISVNDATFYSETYSFYLGPLESVRINEMTPKPQGEFWAIADVSVPTIEECKDMTIYSNRTVNKSFTETTSVRKTVQVKEYVTLGKKISFLHWAFICIILFLITQIINVFLYRK